MAGIGGAVRSLADEMGDWEVHRLRGLVTQLLNEVWGFQVLVQQTGDDPYIAAARSLYISCKEGVTRFESDRLRALTDSSFRRA